LTDLLKLVKEEEVFEFPIAEQPLAEIIKMVDEKKINKTVGLQLLDQVAQTGKDPLTLAKELGLLTTISEEQITSLLQAFKDSNPKAVEDYKKEPQRVIGFIVGYVMKNTAGKANGELVKSLIAKLFG
jgi:aspartyl-tRNA(Asn)/glutamyl-tRNA(Gln) amidotransferase subunit B